MSGIGIRAYVSSFSSIGDEMLKFYKTKAFWNIGDGLKGSKDNR